MNTQLIARLRSGEIAAENNGSLEQLREVLKAARLSEIENVHGLFKFYYLFRGLIQGHDVTRLPAIPITDFFKEDRAVELLRELAHLNNCEMEGILAPTPDKWYEAFNRVGEFLHELNKDK